MIIIVVVGKNLMMNRFFYVEMRWGFHALLILSMSCIHQLCVAICLDFLSIVTIGNIADSPVYFDLTSWLFLSNVNKIKILCVIVRSGCCLNFCKNG